MRPVRLLILLLLVTGPSAAQTVEMEVPTELIVDESRLSVTLAEGVSEEAARAAVTGAGATILEVRFEPGVISAYLEGPPSDSVRTVLATLPGAVDVSLVPFEFDVQRGEAEVEDGSDPSSFRFIVRASFEPSIPASQLQRYQSAIPELHLASVSRLENDVIVSIGADPDALIARLEALPEVAYTAFLQLEAPPVY